MVIIAEDNLAVVVQLEPLLLVQVLDNLYVGDNLQEVRLEFFVETRPPLCPSLKVIAHIRIFALWQLFFVAERRTARAGHFERNRGHSLGWVFIVEVVTHTGKMLARMVLVDDRHTLVLYDVFRLFVARGGTNLSNFDRQFLRALDSELLL